MQIEHRKSKITNPKGWPFPLKPTATGRLSYVTDEAKLRQSIWLILSTAPGERPMRPEFGCDIHDLLGGGNVEARYGLIQHQVYEALTRWEPQIDVIDVQVQVRPELPNHIFIEIDYRQRGHNAIDRLTYPLVVDQGDGGCC